MSTIASAGGVDRPTAPALCVAVDIGGTFTDIAAFDGASRRFFFAKALTTYAGFVSAIETCLREAGLDLAHCRSFRHGTTLIINALLQRRGAKTALVATRGFRDVLEIARASRAVPFDLRFRRDPPLVPRDLRVEVGERVDAGGTVIEPLDSAALTRVAAALTAEGVEAVAVSFINSYANPEHEQQAAARLEALMPDAFITTGSSLSREWYEFERTATAAANAFVGPMASSYIGDLERELSERGFPGKLALMSSGGGVLSAAHVRRAPIDLIESGPVGGLVGASAYAKALGHSHVIAFDMGGTTAKVSLLVDGAFEVQSSYHVGSYEHGFPIRSNVVDIVEVGTGGGSIAHLDIEERLRVGPRSAGSDPGPVCFGRGGTEPTVTDANLVLGRLPTEGLLGGGLNVDAAASTRAIAKLARQLKLAGPGAAHRMAAGVVSIANLAMAGATRKVTIERGHDPRACALLAYGGGGPLHAADVARELHIPTVVIPLHPGNFSALGMLAAELNREQIHTHVAALTDAEFARILQRFETIELSLVAAAHAEFGLAPVPAARFVDMRYKGQMHTVRVTLAGMGDAKALRAAFDDAYRRRYGHSDSSSPAEVVALRASVRAASETPPLILQQEPRPIAPPERAQTGYFLDRGEMQVAVFDRSALGPGFAAAGPAFIQEYGSTILVGPDDRFRVGQYGEVVIDVSADP